MRTPHRLLIAGAAAGLLVLANAAPAAAVPPLPPPRVIQFHPRFVQFTPRVKDVKPKQRKHTYTVNTDVLFAFDSAKLSPDGKNVLAGVVHSLKHKPKGTVTVAGYTDSIGKAGYNLALSRRRARAVSSYLKGHVGNGKLRYKAVGHGEKNPVAPNKKNGHDNAKGRQKNRRVTIHYAG